MLGVIGGMTVRDVSWRAASLWTGVLKIEQQRSTIPPPVVVYLYQKHSNMDMVLIGYNLVIQRSSNFMLRESASIHPSIHPSIHCGNHRDVETSANPLHQEVETIAIML